ncbi:MopE-related protein [Lewinella cohaerens]|uniref:MopE-related protein n=1 Tax=Lewinella cohaerens TaxID=70995 RepID=UPI00146BEEC6|nr:MopE-related protein [Lewinella cohaerens]
MNKIFTLTFLLGCLVFSANAQDGGLDSTFAQTGVLLLDFIEANETANDVEIQEDGKIVVLASGSYGSNNLNVEMVRLLEDGTIDSTFANNGYFFVDNPAGSDIPYDLDIQNDGSFLIAGDYANTINDLSMAVYKVTAEGVLDSMFGTNGIATLPIDTMQDYARTLEVAADGSIFIGGVSQIPGFASFYRSVVGKFTATGVVDSTFGINGAFVWNTDSITTDIRSMEILPDGHLLVSGRAKPAGTDRISLYKVLSDGSGLDTSFGTDGAVLAPYEGTGFDLAIHPNGNILITGQNRTNMGDNLVLAAYDQNGAPVADFGTNGVSFVDADINDRGFSILVQPDGKIIASGESGGTFFQGGPRQFMAARFDAMGVPDSTWGENGVVRTLTSTLFAFSNGSVLQPDGKLVLVGASATPTTQNDLTVVRYNNFIDADMDGFSIADDCDDNNSAINPDAEEIPNNDVDENCDDIILIIDADMDGFNSDEDCDDTDPLINPDAEEIPNNDVDENCDDEILIIDADMDGFNSDEDCDDTDPLINPDAEEIPNNDVDENCDDIILVGVQETEISSQFLVYPNPAGEFVYLKYEAEGQQPQQAVLTNVTGQVLQVINLEFNNHITRLDLANLPQGILILTIQTEAGTAIKRIVKQ